MNILKQQIVGFIFAGCSANIVSFFFYVLLYLGLRMKSIYCSYYALSIYFVGLFIETLIHVGIEYRISWLMAVFCISILNFIFVKFLAFKN